MIAAAVLSPGQKETLQGQGPPWHKRKYSCENSAEEAGSSPWLLALQEASGKHPCACSFGKRREGDAE